MASNRSFLGRLNRALTAFRRSGPDMELLQKQLEVIGSDKPVVEKNATESSKLDIRRTDHDLAYYSAFRVLREWTSKSGKLPPYGSLELDYFLATFWQHEPILAGAIYSMTAKMAALKWSVSGRRNLSLQTAKMLSRAAHMGGFDWGGFISSTASDYYTTNNGVFWETPKNDKGDPLYSSMVDIGHVDSLACTLTGNRKFPMVYSSMTSGQVVRFKPGEFIHFASMPSPREEYLGVGFCFANRAYRAAKLLMGLHDYDDEKLNNLPPEGVASVTGLTVEEFLDAVALYKATRERDNSLTFPQVLWLIGSQPDAGVDVKFTPFSQIPESFDRKTVIDQYVSTLALAAGVDVREFWSLSGGGGLGTAGESEIQHMKAKGKGPGEFISTSERHINGELPAGVDYRFDTQDIEEDANAAAVAKAWIDAFFPIYNLPPKGANDNPEAAVSKANPRPDKPNGQPTLPTTPIPGVNTGRQMTSGGGQPNTPQNAEQVITKDEFKRLLADKGVLPEWMMNDQRVYIEDADVHLDKDLDGQDYTCYEYRNGILKEKRLAPIIINSPKEPDVTYQYAGLDVGKEDDETVIVEYSDEEIKAIIYLKQREEQILAEKRNITGNPIPDKEVTRGSRVTRNTIKDEIERWRNNPILAPYAPETDAEVERILNAAS